MQCLCIHYGCLLCLHHIFSDRHRLQFYFASIKHIVSICRSLGYMAVSELSENSAPLWPKDVRYVLPLLYRGHGSLKVDALTNLVKICEHAYTYTLSGYSYNTSTLRIDNISWLRSPVVLLWKTVHAENLAMLPYCHVAMLPCQRK